MLDNSREASPDARDSRSHRGRHRLRCPGHPHGTLPEELRLVVEAEDDPMQVLRFATSAAAELLGIADEAGTVKPGKAADLEAVAGDLLEDIETLYEMRLVTRGGVEVGLSKEA